MSTIASPRPSLSLSSRRTSASTDTATGRSASLTRPAPSTTRRNRAALREFYNLKGAAEQGAGDGGDTETSAQTGVSGEERGPRSELDKEGFDAKEYVKGVLATEGLEGIMRVEAGIVSGMS